tara:strand:+ start:282 stop:665 length:384 start_codon:yes stop_codon:yes gene_type:complete
MKKNLNKKSGIVTVVIDVTYNESIDLVREFIRNEQCPLFYNLNDDGIIRFEWFVEENSNSATLIEVFENSNVWEELGNKVLGSPINIKFKELFKIERLTVLGDINDSFKDKIQAMNPVIKTYVGGIN